MLATFGSPLPCWAQGRRGEALSVVNRARSAFAELGLERPDRLLNLERSIVA
jgi:hypothetical protein